MTCFIDSVKAFDNSNAVNVLKHRINTMLYDNHTIDYHIYDILSYNSTIIIR